MDRIVNSALHYGQDLSQDLLFTGYHGKFKPLQRGDPGVDPNDTTPW